MIKVLLNAYAVCPDKGSEPGLGWYWCANLARYCELHVITEGEFQQEIENALADFPYANNIKFYYNPLPDQIRKMCWNQGDWRFYKYYKEWQYKSYLLAKDICQKENIDILHQFNMIGFREPGFLWKITDRPLIWGPVDAKEGFPIEYAEGLSLKQKAFIHLKNIITRAQLKYSKRVHQTALKASFVLSASSESRLSFKKYFNIDSPLINETGCYPQKTEIQDNSGNGELNLLWVGKLDVRKQLNIAIRSVAATANKNVRLHIIGGGDQTIYRNMAEQFNVSDQCIWYGAIPHDKVIETMQQCDMMFFTSVAEGTPHVVLEALANNLPVICFNCCGQGDVVNEKVGVKINLSNPKTSIIEFSKIIDGLESERGKVREMKSCCYSRQLELSWDRKFEKVVNLYKKAIQSQ